MRPNAVHHLIPVEFYPDGSKFYEHVCLSCQSCHGTTHDRKHLTVAPQQYPFLFFSFGILPGSWLCTSARSRVVAQGLATSLSDPEHTHVMPI